MTEQTWHVIDRICRIVDLALSSLWLLLILVFIRGAWLGVLAWFVFRSAWIGWKAEVSHD